MFFEQNHSKYMLVGQREEWLFNTCIVDVKYQGIFGLKIYMLSILAMLSQQPASQDRTMAFIVATVS